MRVLWISNSPASASAYSQQTALFLPLLRKAKHDPVIFAFTNFGGPTSTPDGFLQLPRLANPYGNDVMVAHFNSVKADVAISLYDPFAFDPNEYARVPWCAWTPVDSTPVTSANVASLKAARWILAMSRFGEQQLKEAGFGDKTIYVPHGIDVQTFAPSDRAKAREVVSKATGANLDDKFLVVVVGANKDTPSRKGFYEAFSAFKLFSDKHPDAMLYVHTAVLPTFGGEDLLAILDLVKLSKEKVLFVPQYPYLTGAIQPGYLAAVYNAADVYLSASHAEGFGLPAVEAQACGCLVILPDNSAQTELCFEGMLVTTTPYMSMGHVEWRRPNVPALANALEWAHEHARSGDLRAEARRKALAYGVNTVFEKWMVPALKKIANDIQ